MFVRIDQENLIENMLIFEFLLPKFHTNNIIRMYGYNKSKKKAIFIETTFIVWFPLYISYVYDLITWNPSILPLYCITLPVGDHHHTYPQSHTTL